MILAKATYRALLFAVFSIAAILCMPSAAPAAEGVQPVDESGVAIEASAASLDAAADVTVSGDETEAIAADAAFGITDFSRQNKGTNKKYEGAYYGYRYPMPSEDAFSAIIARGYAVIYIPAGKATSVGVDVDDPAFQETFLSTLAAIDSASAHGGQLLTSLDGEAFYFTTSQTVVVGDYTYRFGVEVEEGYHYATATLAGSEDGSGGGIYAESGILADAASMDVVPAATGLDALGEFFAKLDWRPLWVSMRTTLVAIVAIFLIGLLAAWATMRMSSRAKGVFDTIFTIPMVLPPTVCGFLLLWLFGKASITGQWLIEHGLDIVFTWPATVIACTVVGFPLMYRTARGAFENVDPAMLDAARTLGWGEWRIFLRLMVPLAWPSIAAGTVLAFARAMGEFGCTLFFAGNYPGETQTIPIAIYFDWIGGDHASAWFWVIVVILISFLVILFINIYSSRTQRYRRGGVEKDEPKDRH